MGLGSELSVRSMASSIFTLCQHRVFRTAPQCTLSFAQLRIAKTSLFSHGFAASSCGLSGKIHQRSSILFSVNSADILGSSSMVSFPERPDMKVAFLTTQPFVLRRETARKRPFTMALKFKFSDGCLCSFSTIFWGVNFQVKASSFIREKDAVLKKLRDDADQEPQCGQQEVMERQILPRSESSTHAITTNIVRYNISDATKIDKTCDSSKCRKDNNWDEVLSKRVKWY